MYEYWRGSDIILVETHKLISTKLYQHIEDRYEIKLNYNQLIWGSISPDILPQYKIKRHYYENSIDFIVLKIAKVIFFNRFLDLKKTDVSSIKLFSYDIGVISHYIADYTCLAHAEDWAMPKNLVRHLNYEKELNEYAKSHEFNSEILEIKPKIANNTRLIYNAGLIKNFISKAIDEYMEEKSMARDLDYAFAINIEIFEYIIESIMEHSHKFDLVY